jgi:hypothetical protein
LRARQLCARVLAIGERLVDKEGVTFDFMGARISACYLATSHPPASTSALDLPPVSRPGED